ncbi:MAG: hypothetical protein P8Y06_01925 [Patescibacteria group bacterium]|jgi:hypothetical protein
MVDKEVLRRKSKHWESELTTEEKLANTIRDMGATEEAVNWIIEKAERINVEKENYFIVDFKQKIDLEELDIPNPTARLKINSARKVLTGEVRTGAKNIVTYNLGGIEFLDVVPVVDHLIIKTRDRWAVLLISPEGTLHFTRA